VSRRAPAEPVRVEVEALDPGGRGVARHDGRRFAVEGALPGERVRARIVRRRGGDLEGSCVEVLGAPAPARTVPRCPHFEECGGCRLQHLTHDAQVAVKQERLLLALAAAGGPARVLDPIVGPAWGYRRRARLGVRFVRPRGEALVGFREKLARGVAVLEACEVLAPAVGRRLRALRDLVTGLAARERIPQIEVAAGDDGTALVFRHLDPLGEHDRAALERFARDSGIQVHLQPGGPETLAPLWPPAPPALRYRLPAQDLALEFGPLDFAQVNAGVNRALVTRALALLAPAPGARVLDLYCGIGNFTLAAARAGAHAHGLEGAPALVERARANAALNGLAREVAFETVDLGDPRALAPWLDAGCDAVLLDPPRPGARVLTESLGAPYPGRVVYVSCNPDTLARDAAALVGRHGYRLDAAGVVDMFPHTAHSEAIALFTRG